MNAGWHKANPIPSQGSVEERIDWHLAHAEACACRGIPATVRRELKARGIQVPGADRDAPRKERWPGH